MKIDKHVFLLIFLIVGFFSISQIHVKINFTVINPETKTGVKSCLCIVKDLSGKTLPFFAMGDSNGLSQLTFTDPPSQFLVSVKAIGYFGMDYLMDLESVPFHENLNLALTVNLSPIGNASAKGKDGDITSEANYLYELPKARFKYYSKSRTIEEDLIYKNFIGKTNKMVGTAMESKYKIAQEEFKIEKNKNDLLVKDLEITQQQKQRKYLLIIIGFIALITFLSVYAYFRQKKLKEMVNLKKIEAEEQREIANHQKHLVEEKQKEIVDSIRYAKRIQSTQLPTDKYIAKNIDRLKK